MKWINSEVPSYAGSGGVKPANVETHDLLDSQGNVVKRFAKAADGSISEKSQVFTPAVARVVTGTIDTALSGANVVLQFGNLYVHTGTDVANDDDGTELIPFLQARTALIPADNVLDNEDGSFAITFHPGANGLPLVSGDVKLTFSEDTAGADAVRSLVSTFSVPDTLPVVPETTPDAQDIIDALVALGLVTQSD